MSLETIIAYFTMYSTLFVEIERVQTARKYLCVLCNSFSQMFIHDGLCSDDETIELPLSVHVRVF